MRPFLVIMSKIVKHTFEIPNLSVQDGELVEGKPTIVTYTFTLLFKGFGLFEEIHGSSLFSAMLEMYSGGEETESAKNFLSSSTLKDLAAASYVKIDGDKFHNNRATVEEFRKSPVCQLVENDTDFITELSQMATECLYDKAKKSAQKAGESRPKK